MLFLIDPMDPILGGCTEKVSCHPKFYPLYGVPPKV